MIPTTIVNYILLNFMLQKISQNYFDKYLILICLPSERVLFLNIIKNFEGGKIISTYIIKHILYLKDIYHLVCA